MFYPDNFLYFISLFFISVFGGTYLLFAYYRNRLLFFNALMFYFCAIRACTEFILPTLDSLEQANQLAIFHSLLVNILSFFEWYCIWFYIKPFSGWHWEKIINQAFLWLLLIIPVSIKSILLAQRELFIFYPEKIDGYWQFMINVDSVFAQPYFFHGYLMEYMSIFALVISIYRNPKFRMRQSLLLLSFIVIPFLFYTFSEPITAIQAAIPNTAGLLLFNTLIISWFISDYRIFRNSFNEATKDVLDSVSDLVIFCDTNQNIINLNEKAAQFFSKTPKNIKKLFKNNSFLMPDVIQQQLEDLVSRAKKDLEIKLLNSGKKEHIFTLKVTQFKKNNKMIGYTWLLTDITKMRANEEKLIKLDKIKDQLFAIIGHDLRKPALAFRGVSKKVNYLLQEKQYDLLSQIGAHLETAAINLNKLLDNLLKWALTQRNSLETTIQPHDIQPIIDHILRLFEQMIAEKEIDFQVDIMPHTILLGDRDITATIMRNLIDNAIKFTPQGNNIQLSINSSGTEVICKLKDSGIGMTPSQIKKIFQLDKEKSTEGTKGEKGVGLGMVLVKELVAAQNGTINISSKPNKGTLVELSFPAA